MQFGRTEAADCCIEDDELLSRLHFAIDSDPNQCRIRDLGSRNGTYLNGDSVKVGTLTDGDQVTAGQTSFQVHFQPIGTLSEDAMVPATKTDTEKAWSMDRLQPGGNEHPDDPPTMKPTNMDQVTQEFNFNFDQTLSIDAYRTPFSGSSNATSLPGESPKSNTPMQTMDSAYGDNEFYGSLPHNQEMTAHPGSQPVNPNLPPMAYTQSITANGLVCFKPYQKQTRAVDIGRLLSNNPLFFLAVNLDNMEPEARTFFSSPVYGTQFEKIGNSLILISQKDSIDILELFHRGLGRDAMIGFISRLSKHQLGDQLKAISQSLLSPRQFLNEINHSVPENLRGRMYGIDAVMLEDDASDGWSIYLAPDSSLNWQSIGFVNPPMSV